MTKKKRTFSFGRFYRETKEKIYVKYLRHKLQRNGRKTIAFIQETFVQAGLLFYFDMGTLLGIIREGRLLGHDMDIDTAVFAQSKQQKDEFRKLLLDKGCTLRKAYEIDGIGVVEESFEYNRIKFDVSYFTYEGDSDVGYLMYRDHNKSYAGNEMSVVKIQTPHNAATKLISFQGMMINVPIEAEKYLAARYGENWRIPDKGYVYWKGPSTVPTDLIGKFR